MGWIQNWLSKRNDEADLKAELAAHLAIEQNEQRQQGKSPEESERIARQLFGNLTKTEENVRNQWRWTGLERFFSDCRFGIRLLLRSPVWSAVVCLTLALGIGLSTAIFSVVYAVLLEPLPYSKPDRIVAIHPITAGPTKERFNPNAGLWRHWGEHLTTVEDLALTRLTANFNFTGEGAPERLQGSRTTFNLPRVLGVKPLYGRAFTEEEQLADVKVVLLSYGLWKRRFGADPSAIGRKIQLNGTPYEIVGVMPETFRYPDATFDLWAPLYLPPRDIGHGFDYGLLCAGRLKAGVTLRQAQAQLTTVMAELSREFPAAYRAGTEHTAGVIQPLAQSQAQAIRPLLLMLTSAVACLLAIGCMNLAVLLIAKASGRSREILVRIALGASGSRLRRQLLAEAFPIGLIGAAGGLFVAFLFLELLVPLLPAGIPRVESIRINSAVMAFSILCSLAVVCLASLLPSTLASLQHLAGHLQASARTIAPGNRLRDALVVGQVTVALLLLFGGILFTRSFAALQKVQPGFSQDNVLSMHMAVSRSRFPEDEQVAAYYDRLVARLKSIPGVVDAGFINRLPLSGTAQTNSIDFENKQNEPLAAAMFMIDSRSVTPGYFNAMGIPLIRGRLLNENDRPDSPRVGLIDATIAKRTFGDENPIGKRFRTSNLPGRPNNAPWVEIVGVVGHVLHDSLEKDARPQMYWPETQRAQDRAALVVRTEGEPASYAKAIVAQIQSENPDQPVYDVRTMNDWLGRSMRTRTVATSLVSLFGIASVLLACLGLYGAISYTTSLRLREFGIRLALGASGRAVRGLVLRQAGRIVGLGILIGLVLCWPAGFALRSFLFGVGNLDLVSWTLAPGLLLCLGLLAGLIPALRAAKVDPARTLQAE